MIKLLKGIRDGSAGGIGPRGRGEVDRSDNDDNDDNDDMANLETEEEAAEKIAKTSHDDKVFNVLNKLKNNIEYESILSENGYK